MSKKSPNIFHGKYKNKEFEPTNKQVYDEFLFSINNKPVWIRIERTTGKRTPDQNSSLHLYCEHLAKELNDGGYTVQLVLKEKIDLNWDKEKVKELLWRPAQEALTGKHSTTQLDKVEDIDNIYEHLNRHIGEKFGIHVPFPHDPLKKK